MSCTYEHAVVFWLIVSVTAGLASVGIYVLWKIARNI